MLSQLLRSDWRNAHGNQLSQAFLNTPLLQSSLPQLSENIASMHKQPLVHQRTQSPELILEVVNCLDISQSFYSQLMKSVEGTQRSNKRNAGRRLVNAEATEQQDAVNVHFANQVGKRLLRLTLTDGYQQVEAMERIPVPAISLTMPLGYKIRLRNARILRGIVQLTPDCVEVLGGSNTELIGKTYEVRLREALNLPVETTENTVEQSDMMAQETVTVPQIRTQQNQQIHAVPNDTHNTAAEGNDDIQIIDENMVTHHHSETFEFTDDFFDYDPNETIPVPEDEDELWEQALIEIEQQNDNNTNNNARVEIVLDSYSENPKSPNPSRKRSSIGRGSVAKRKEIIIIDDDSD